MNKNQNFQHENDKVIRPRTNITFFAWTVKIHVHVTFKRMTVNVFKTKKICLHTTYIKPQVIYQTMPSQDFFKFHLEVTFRCQIKKSYSRIHVHCMNTLRNHHLYQRHRFIGVTTLQYISVFTILSFQLTSALLYIQG